MNVPELTKRIDNLSKKLVDEHKEHIGRFDSSSFTDAENLLFRKYEELQEKYGTHLPRHIIDANEDLIHKAHLILLKYVIGTFKFAIVSSFGNPQSQRDNNYFDTFLYSFLTEVCNFLKEANKKGLSDDDFVGLFDKYDVFGKLSKIAGNSHATSMSEKKEPELKTEDSEDNENEH